MSNGGRVGGAYAERGTASLDVCRRVLRLRQRLGAFQKKHPYKSIRVSGKSWPYLSGEAGERTFLLLPGSVLVPEVYFMLLEEIERDFRVLAPAYPPVRSVAEFVAGADAILDAEGVESAAVFGSSFGGYLAQCYVRARPERVGSLILAQTGTRHFAGTGSLRLYARLLSALPESLARGLVWRLWMRLFEFPPEERWFWVGFMRGIMFSRLSKEHLAGHAKTLLDFAESYALKPGDLSGWQGKMLILESQRDEIFGPEARVKLRATYPGARVHTFREASHSSILTNPRGYSAAIQSFLGAI